jgi:hypothetical protein
MSLQRIEGSMEMPVPQWISQLPRKELKGWVGLAQWHTHSWSRKSLQIYVEEQAGMGDPPIEYSNTDAGPAFTTASANLIRARHTPSFTGGTDAAPSDSWSEPEAKAIRNLTPALPLLLVLEEARRNGRVTIQTFPVEGADLKFTITEKGRHKPGRLLILPEEIWPLRKRGPLGGLIGPQRLN